MDSNPNSKQPRVSGNVKRKQEIERLTTNLDQCNTLITQTKKERSQLAASVTRNKIEYERALQSYNESRRKMQEKNLQIYNESKHIEKVKTELDKLLAEDDIKNKSIIQKKEEAIQRKHNKRGGKKFDITTLDKLPLEVVLYVGEFLSYDFRIQYLEDSYKPYSIFNKLGLSIKRNFVQLLLKSYKNFTSLTKKRRNEFSDKIHFAGCKTINNEIGNFIYQMKQECPEDAHKLIRKMCIMFKKNRKYNINWHTYFAENSRILRENMIIAQETPVV
jgi:hypothetical protein